MSSVRGSRMQTSEVASSSPIMPFQLETPSNHDTTTLKSFNHRGYALPNDLVASAMAGKNSVPIRGVHIHVVNSIFGPNVSDAFDVDPDSVVLPFQSETTIYPKRWNEPGESMSYVPEKSKNSRLGLTYQELSQAFLRRWYVAHLTEEFSSTGAIGKDQDAYFKSHCFTIDVDPLYVPETAQEAEELNNAARLGDLTDKLKKKVYNSSAATSTSAFVAYLSLLRSNGFVEGRDFYISSDETLTRSNRPHSTFATRKGKKAIYMSNSVLASKEKMLTILSFNSFIVAIENFLTMKFGNLDCIGVGEAFNKAPHIFVEVIGFASFDDLKNNQHDLEFSDSRYRAWQAWMFNTGSYIYRNIPNSPFPNFEQFVNKIALSNEESRDDTEFFLRRFPQRNRNKPNELSIYGFYTIQQQLAEPIYSSNVHKNFVRFIESVDRIFQPNTSRVLSPLAEIQPVAVTLSGEEPYDMSQVKSFRSERMEVQQLVGDQEIVAKQLKSQYARDFLNNIALTVMPLWFAQYSALPDSLLFGEYFHRDELVWDLDKVKNLGAGGFGAVVRTKWRASRSSLFTPDGKLRGSGKHAFNHHTLILDTLNQKRRMILYIEALEARGVDAKTLYKDVIGHVPVENITLVVLSKTGELPQTAQLKSLQFDANSTVADYDDAIAYIGQAVSRDLRMRGGKLNTDFLSSFMQTDSVSFTPSSDSVVVAYDTAVSIDVAVKLSNSQQQVARREYCIVKSLFANSNVAKHPVKTYDLLNPNEPIFESAGTGHRSTYPHSAGNLNEISSWGVLTTEDAFGIQSFKIVATTSDGSQVDKVLLSIRLEMLRYNSDNDITLEPGVATLKTTGINNSYGLGYDSSVIFTVIPFRINGDLNDFLTSSHDNDHVDSDAAKLPITFENIMLAQQDFKSKLGKTRRPLTLFEFLSIMKDAAIALNRMNSKGIMHGDVKEANILVGPAREAYVTDFSLSTPYGCPVGLAGTEGYVPDEIGVIWLAPRESDMYTPVDTYVDAYAFSRILKNYLALNFETNENTREISYCGCCYNSNMIRRALKGGVDKIFKTKSDYSCFMSSKIRPMVSSKIPASMVQLPVEFVEIIRADLDMLADIMAQDYIGDNRPADLEKSIKAAKYPMDKIVTDFGSRELLQKGCTRFYVAELVLDYLMKSIVEEAEFNWGRENIIPPENFSSFKSARRN